MSAAMAEGYMDDSVVRLEPRLVRIESGVASVNERMERVEQGVERLDGRMDRLDGRMDRLDERVSLIDRRLVAVEVNTENIKENLGKLDVDMREMRKSNDDKFESLQGDIRGLMRFLVAIVITFFTTLIGFGAGILTVLAKGLHWLK